MAIKQGLKDRAEQPSAFHMLYEISDGLVVVPEHDGRKRLVVPDGPLQQDICKHFHNECGHAGLHRTLYTIAHYFFWANMSKNVKSYVASCAACQAAKGANRLPGGVSEPHDLPADPG